MSKSASSSLPPSIAALLRHFWHACGARRWHLLFPLLLVLLAGLFDAVSFGLLVPLTRAIGHDSFGAFSQVPLVAGWFARVSARPGGFSREAALAMLAIGGIVVARAAKLVTDYARNRFVVARSERYRVAASDETFRRVLGFGRQYFSQHPIGAVDAEVGWTDALVRSLLAVEEIVRYLIALGVKVTIMFALSAPLTIAFAVSLPLVGWFVGAVDRRVTRIADELMFADRLVRSRLLDMLGSIPLVKVNSQERAASRAYHEALEDARRLIVRREQVTSLRYPLEELAVLVLLLAVQGLILWQGGHFSPADLAPFAAFLLLVQQALPDAKWINQFLAQLAQDRPRLRALARLYDDADKYIVPSGPRPFAGLRDAIVVDGLQFGYTPDAPVLHDVRAVFAAGRMTAIVGHSGAGKTTLVDLLVRLYDCPPNVIRFDGVDVREFDIPSLHARTAVVSQDVWLLNRSLRDNLTFGLERPLLDASLHEALADVGLAEFARGLPRGLDTEIGDRGVRLSGGQRQRIALARALLRQPELLILDEATSALDSVVEQQVARAIQARAAGQTLIVIAHRLSTIRNAEHIIVLDQGRVAESGTWDELLTRHGVFARLHDAQLADPSSAQPA